MITMAEIAKRAGVSRATASVVLNDRDTSVRISASTRQRVLAVAEEMGYRRNELARAVVTGKNFVLGLLERQSSLEQRARILSGALAEADTHGYHIKVWPCPDQQKLNELARRCVGQRLAGVIVIRPADVAIHSLHQELTRYHIPMVLVDDSLAEPGIINVGSDDIQGSWQALEHLIGLGHRRIACMTGMPGDTLSMARERGYREAMAAHGLPVPEGYVVYNHWKLSATEGCIHQLFAAGTAPPTALFAAAGDAYAAVSIRVLRSMGIAVPAQVSVVGYADLGFAELIDPPLTTVSQPFTEMGSVAVNLLMSIINADQPTAAPCADQLLPTCMVVRASTAPVFAPSEAGH